VPWSEQSIMSQRHEFVMLFEQDGVNRRELCRRFGISPTIGYRLLARWRQEGQAGLAPPTAFAGAQRGGDGSPGAGGTRRASRLGRAQDSPPAARSQTPAGAERQHDHGDPASAWSHRRYGERRPQTV
jgi:transposase-like protein